MTLSEERSLGHPIAPSWSLHSKQLFKKNFLIKKKNAALGYSGKWSRDPCQQNSINLGFFSYFLLCVLKSYNSEILLLHIHFYPVPKAEGLSEYLWSL